MATKIPTRKAYQPDIVQTAGRKVKMDSSIEKLPSSRLSSSTNSKGAKTKEHLYDPISTAFTQTIVDQVPKSGYGKTMLDVQDTSWNNNTMKDLSLMSNAIKSKTPMVGDLAVNLSQEILKSIDSGMEKQKNTYGRKETKTPPLKRDKHGNSITPFTGAEYNY